MQNDLQVASGLFCSLQLYYFFSYSYKLESSLQVWKYQPECHFELTDQDEFNYSISGLECQQMCFGSEFNIRRLRGEHRMGTTGVGLRAQVFKCRAMIAHGILTSGSAAIGGFRARPASLFQPTPSSLTLFSKIPLSHPVSLAY